MLKERIEFCKGAKCAKVTINIGDEAPIVLFSKFPPLILEIEEKKSEEFTHKMNQPIEKEFSSEVTGIENTGGFWVYNSDGGPKFDCPMPGTYPILAGGPRDMTGITDLYWEGNKLFSYFDAPRAFFNNQGSCSYKVYLGFERYRFSDQQGVLYENRPQKILKYKVECDACCKEDEILCDSPHFPGYTCYPISPIARRVLAGKNDIARFWR